MTAPTPPTPGRTRLDADPSEVLSIRLARTSATGLSIEAIDAAARAAGETRSLWVRRVLAEAVEKQKGAGHGPTDV